LGKDVGGGDWDSGTSGNTGDTTVTPATTGRGGAAGASVTLDNMKDAIGNAKSSGGAIVVAPKTTGTVHSMKVEFGKDALSAIGQQTSSDLTVQTPVGNVTIPHSALASITAQASGGTVTVSLATVDNSSLTPAQREAVGDNPVYDISVTSGGSSISNFGGNSITVSLPYALQEGEDPSGVTVWYLNDAGELEQVACDYDPATGLAVFTTGHLSRYVVGYEQETVALAPLVPLAPLASWTNPFSDVKEGDWFYDSVAFVVQEGLFSGTSATTFSPNEPMTRAMLVTVLYRLEGEPAVTGANSFSDVGSGQWYTDAVIWANANSIVTGYGDGLFGTNDPITREQMAAMLLRYADYKKYNTSKTNDLAAFTDADSIASYALGAMKWANAEGLIIGRTATTLTPTGTATRAEVAVILTRFMEKIAK